jgi:hypothetical protein
MNFLKLSIVNPDELPEKSIDVDNEYRYRGEDNFNDKNIAWLFYGVPYYNKVEKGGSITQLYGFEYSFGYLVNTSNPEIMYDVIYGLLIKRLDLDDSNWSYSDEDDYKRIRNNKEKIKKYNEKINIFNETYYKYKYKFEYENENILINQNQNKFKPNGKRLLDTVETY